MVSSLTTLLFRAVSKEHVVIESKLEVSIPLLLIMDVFAVFHFKEMPVYEIFVQR